MLTRHLFCFTSLCLALVAAPDIAAQSGPLSLLDGIPAHLVENRGQYAEAVRYVVSGRDKTIFLTEEGLRIVLHNPGHGESPDCAVDLKPVTPRARGLSTPLRIEALDRLPAMFSYFRGPHDAWTTACASYGAVAYRNAWPGADLVVRGVRGKIKYDIVLRPGIDPRTIALDVTGQTQIEVTKSGSLRIVTPAGVIEDEAPTAHQIIDGQRVDVEATFEVRNSSKYHSCLVGFHVSQYDPAYELVIDPAVIVYCGYVGGGSADSGIAIAVGPDGCTHFAGGTASTETEFPVRTGPCTTHSSGSSYTDGFVGKVDSQGRLVYCGYIGGVKSDVCTGIAVDREGYAYVAGGTKSDETSFPVLGGPGLVHHGDEDVFVAKVTPGGAALVYCGYIGGANAESALDVAIDPAGNVYVAGMVSSDETTFPVKVGPTLKFSRGTYNHDGFVAKVDRSGKSLLYCGYIGGTAYDICKGIAVDAVGAAYLCGPTDSSETSFPIKNGPTLKHAGSTDAFIAKVMPDGSGFEYCGYIGGTGSEGANGLTIDAAGQAYVVGYTSSTEATFPVKGGPDLTFNSVGMSSLKDAFIAKVARDGRSLVYCGYIGGAKPDQAWAVAVDALGRAYVAGETRSDQVSFPVADGPDSTYNDDQTLGDAFLARVSPTGITLDFCGYVGGKALDAAYGVGIDTLGTAYLVGTTFSNENSFPVKDGPDLTFNDWPSRSLGDAFIARIGVTWLELSGTARIGSTLSLHLSASHGEGLGYQAGSSLGAGPIPIGPHRLDLSADGLLAASVSGGLPGVFVRYAGMFPPDGTATAEIRIPNDPALAGLRIYNAFLVLDPTAPFGVDSTSPGRSFSILP